MRMLDDEEIPLSKDTWTKVPQREKRMVCFGANFLPP